MSNLSRAVAASCAVVLALALRGASEPPDETSLGKPGANHARLKPLAGSFETEAKFMGVKMKGTITGTWRMGGRYLDLGGELDMGAAGKDELMATMGYANFEKHYFMIFYIGSTTNFIALEGQADADGKTITLEGEEKMPDGSKAKSRVVLRLASEDEWTMEIWYPGEKGKLELLGEYKNKRTK